MNANPSTSASQSWLSRHSGSLFVSGFGLVFLVAGLLIRFLAVPSVRARRRWSTRWRSFRRPLQPTSRRACECCSRLALLLTRPRCFATSSRSVSGSSGGWKDEGARRHEQWETKEVVTPPLALGDGPDRITSVAAAYEISREPHSWRSTPGLQVLALRLEHPGCRGVPSRRRRDGGRRARTGRARSQHPRHVSGRRHQRCLSREPARIGSGASDRGPGLLWSWRDLVLGRVVHLAAPGELTAQRREHQPAATRSAGDPERGLRTRAPGRGPRQGRRVHRDIASRAPCGDWRRRHGGHGMHVPA